ncbi:MAG: hypothetical protein ABJB74_03015 [Gemmatimonas sp.]
MSIAVMDEPMGVRAFFDPHFSLAIAGEQVEPTVFRDVTSVTYHDDITKFDGFELEVGNWDPDTATYRYIGSETEDTLTKHPNWLYRLFEPGKKHIELSMGYVDNLRLMMTGSITAIEPKFGASGATMTVRGLNVLHELRKKQYTKDWHDLNDTTIAKRINHLKDPDTHADRFPLKIVTDPNVTTVNELPKPDVSQKNEYDIDFLYRRAQDRGYVLVVHESEQGKPQLYFGPPSETVPGLREVTYRLEWGKSLIDFNPTLSTANQVKSVTVMGWDRKTHSRIKGVADLNDKRLQANRDLFRLLNADAREDVVVHEAVRTPEEAHERAFNILSERLRNIVKASASTIGLPDLRAGQRVEIVGVGSRLSGTYFVTASTHTFNDQGYITKFEARREDLGFDK